MRRLMIVLASIGLLDAAYLTWIKVASQEAVCSGIGQCEVVNNSTYAEIGGIPIALFGAGAYILILAFLLFEERSEFVEVNGPLIVFGLSLAGVLYSAYLTYIELYILRAICPFCVLSAVVLVLLLVLSGLRLRQIWSVA